MAIAKPSFVRPADNFLRCLENAFWQFGGVPLRLLLDNLKADVLQADWYDPELNLGSLPSASTAARALALAAA